MTTPSSEKKTPMTRSMKPAGIESGNASISGNDTVTTYRSRSTEMNLIKEALSRSRMRQPLNEANRSARRVAMEARRMAARELGDVSQLMPR
jgi:hypothetical protein